MLPFFKGPFMDCLVGKADLKEAIEPYLKAWKWEKSVDEFLNYWFKSEDKTDKRVIDTIKELQVKGIKCYMGTNQEKYRTEYMANQMGFGNVFDKIFSSAHLGYVKPDYEFFHITHLKILEDIPNIKKEEIMFWDDSSSNIENGEKYGFNSNHYTGFDEFKDKIKNLL